MYLTRFYQTLSPLILLFILNFLYFKEMYIIVLIVIVIIVLLNIMNKLSFDNYNDITLEAGRLIGYIVLVLYFTISLLSLLQLNTSIHIYIVIISTLILSLHIRLIKVSFSDKSFTYNTNIMRNQSYVTNKTFRYPKFSNYTLFRIEFYILLLLFTRLIVGILQMPYDLKYIFIDGFNVIFITILIDIIIYLTLKKYTRLLK